MNLLAPILADERQMRRHRAMGQQFRRVLPEKVNNLLQDKRLSAYEQ